MSDTPPERRLPAEPQPTAVDSNLDAPETPTAVLKSLATNPALDAALKPMSSPALDAAATQTAALRSLAANPALDAALKAMSSPALDAATRQNAALMAIAKSPALEAARNSFAASGALTALLKSPAAGPSPLASALASAAIARPAPVRLPPPSLPAIAPTPPHRLAPQRWRRTVLTTITQLGDRLLRRHEGAWDAIHRGGPDSTSQAASSIIELMKGALRESAPHAQVLEWLDNFHEPGWGRDSKGFPTLRARAEFLLLQQGVPRRSASALAGALAEVCKDLEEVKHGRSDATMRFVVSALLTFEAIFLVSAPSSTDSA